MCQPSRILQDPPDLKSSLPSYFIGPYNLQISSDFCYCFIYNTFISNFMLNGPVMSILPYERDILNSNPSEVFTFSNIFVNNNKEFFRYLQQLCECPHSCTAKWKSLLASFSSTHTYLTSKRPLNIAAQQQCSKKILPLFCWSRLTAMLLKAVMQTTLLEITKTYITLMFRASKQNCPIMFRP